MTWTLAILQQALSITGLLESWRTPKAIYLQYQAKWANLWMIIRYIRVNCISYNTLNDGHFETDLTLLISKHPRVPLSIRPTEWRSNRHVRMCGVYWTFSIGVKFLASRAGLDLRQLFWLNLKLILEPQRIRIIIFRIIPRFMCKVYMNELPD